MRSSRNTSRFALTLIVLAVVGGVVLPGIANAQPTALPNPVGVGVSIGECVADFDDCLTGAAAKAASVVIGAAANSFGTDIVTRGMAAMVSLLTIFFGVWLFVGGMLLNWAFTLGSLTSATFVQTGWSIARDLVNMLFILLLLLIAFATILRYESYGIKQILPRLIVVALLINFSLLGAGIIIDVGTSLGEYFTTGGDNSIEVSANMMSALGVHRTLLVGDSGTVSGAGFLEEVASGQDGWELLVYSLSNLLFVLVATFIFVARYLSLIQ